jgi:hypothetical protein
MPNERSKCIEVGVCLMVGHWFIVEYADRG